MRPEPRAKRGRPGPPSGYALLPWLLLGLGSFSNLVQGETPSPWIGGAGLLVFNSLYIAVVFRSFVPAVRNSSTTWWLLGAMAVTTFGLAGGYGGSWLMFFPLFGLACGSVLRGRLLGYVGFPLTAAAGAVAARHEGWDAITIAYGTFISMMVTAAILTLAETVTELRETRQELARSAVERERLRFSRDLHDLLGHTLSVIVVKAEAARRIAPRDLDSALTQVSDIESVGRQALTEIREAVSGYREGSLSADLDRARSALTAAGVEPLVRLSGPPLEPQTEVLLGWVVREAVTNVVRHSSATHCVITLDGSADQVRLEVTDDGVGPLADLTNLGAGDGDSTTGGNGDAPIPHAGTGIRGLTERLAAAGGSLDTGPAGDRDAPARGFRVTAVLPVDSSARATDLSATGPADADADVDGVTARRGSRWRTARTRLRLPDGPAGRSRNC
ncbi:sensor histidine kinase [Streptomyces liangshanensis]|uniref:Sensor histidine kinase n=1 Tax=Streptomyces liangshanensis TaxID=2717324 RepID=A0A6G9H3I0_9ACTN|nr:sensor histidine kinase [Streptomyces liangshanensis]QIQ05030.1 sensor histidine kinase [Streptomyces liangshanensis]